MNKQKKLWSSASCLRGYTMSVFRLLKQIRKKRGPKIDPEGALEKTEAKEKKEKKNIT